MFSNDDVFCFLCTMHFNLYHCQVVYNSFWFQNLQNLLGLSFILYYIKLSDRNGIWVHLDWIIAAQQNERPMIFIIYFLHHFLVVWISVLYVTTFIVYFSSSFIFRLSFFTERFLSLFVHPPCWWFLCDNFPIDNPSISLSTLKHTINHFLFHFIKPISLTLIS